MTFEGSSRPMDASGPLSRRTFLAASAAFAATASSAGRKAMALSGKARTLAYVGTNTIHANGRGIYLFEMDLSSGRLSLLKLAAGAVNATWLALHPSGRSLYAIHEIESIHGKKSGSVSAYAVHRTSGDLRRLNTVSSEGTGPAYLSLDKTGTYAFVANYYGGSIAVLPIQPDGSLAPAVDVHRDRGHVGRGRASSGPPGSFAISGHDAPHAHMIHPDPENRFVLQTDLGQDRIYVYRFHKDAGKLTPAETPFVSLPSGVGPRHFAFHPNGQWMYSIQEEASTVVFFHYDARTGLPTPQQTLSTLPPHFAGSSFGSEIAISSDGRFLYAGNRLHNSVATFAIGRQGRLRYLGEAMTMGDYPSQFNMDPSGRFLYACNQRSDQITSFHADHESGQLSFTGQYAPVGSPMCIVFALVS